MTEVKKCPKCGGEMAEGEHFLFPYVSYLLAVESGDTSILFSCKKCGYIELYKEMKRNRN